MTTTSDLMPGIQIITDDTEAKLFLMQHNRLACLVPTPPFDHAFCVWQTDDSFCAASFDTGHALPDDNGYTVVLLSREHFSPEAAAALIAEMRNVARLAGSPGTTRIEIADEAFN